MGHLPENVLVDYTAQYGGALVKLVPALRQRIAVEVSDPTPGIDERLALFEAIAGLMKTVAAMEPTLLVLEDLHWADPGTALLLKHLARTVTGVPFMIVGNFREIAIDDAHPMAKTLADLRREQGIQRVELTGLDSSEVIEMLTAAAGHELDAASMELADRIHRECGGSPFMVNEILLHLVDTGGLVHEDGRWKVVGAGEDLNIPASVREVISQRIARLGETTQAVLRTAAVIGLAFDYQVLVAVSKEDEDDILDALDVGVGAALLWDPSDFDGRFSFGHAVFQKTLYDELGPTRRARIHRLVAEHLEASGDARPADLARHWSAAGAVGDRDKVRHYSKLAGDAAMADLAYEDAARHYQRAIDAVAGDDEETRLDLLLDLGAAQRAAGVAEFTPTLRNAAAIAHRPRRRREGRARRARRQPHGHVAGRVGHRDDRAGGAAPGRARRSRRRAPRAPGAAARPACRGVVLEQQAGVHPLVARRGAGARPGPRRPAHARRGDRDAPALPQRSRHARRAAGDVERADRARGAARRGRAEAARRHVPRGRGLRGGPARGVGGAPAGVRPARGQGAATVPRVASRLPPHDGRRPG